MRSSRCTRCCGGSSSCASSSSRRSCSRRSSSSSRSRRLAAAQPHLLPRRLRVLDLDRRDPLARPDSRRGERRDPAPRRPRRRHRPRLHLGRRPTRASRSSTSAPSPPGSILLGRRGGLVAAGLAAVFYAVLVDLMYFGVAEARRDGGAHAAPLDAADARRATSRSTSRRFVATALLVSVRVGQAARGARRPRTPQGRDRPAPGAPRSVLVARCPRASSRRTSTAASRTRTAPRRSSSARRPSTSSAGPSSASASSARPTGRGSRRRARRSSASRTTRRVAGARTPTSGSRRRRSATARATRSGAS